MDSYDIIVTPDAEADLFEIRDYIARTLLVPDVALNYIRTLQEEMQKLTYMASKGVRKIIVKNFYVYYRLDVPSGKVYILNVIYAKRDQLKVLNRINLNK